MAQGHDLTVQRLERIECLLDLDNICSARMAAFEGDVNRPSSIEASAAELAWGSGSR